MGGAEQVVYIGEGKVMGRVLNGANTYLASETQESGHWVCWTADLSSHTGSSHISITQIFLRKVGIKTQQISRSLA